jgi:hypothetical protein
MSSHLRVSRRTLLCGLGAAVALPLLEAMSLGSEQQASTTARPPVRLAYLYVPNGVHLPDWTPRTVGADFQLPAVLEPLQSVRDDLLVLSGLALDPARAHGDGGGDHARAMAAFLTGQHPRRTNGANLRAGVSVDQVAAQRLGRATRFATLEIGCEAGLQAGSCDHGYSCAYQTNLSWRGEATPMPKEINPRLVFERLFGGDAPHENDTSRERRERTRSSILDYVADDARRLQGRLGSGDRRRLDEYLTAVRELERRLARSQPAVAVGSTQLARPAGIPADYREHLRLMSDLLVLAFQTDATRIATFVYGNDGSNRSYRTLGVPEGHHDLSHHGGDAARCEKLKSINRFHVAQFAYLLERLKSIPERDGTLLDNCMIVYGSGISDGDRHNHEDLPILLAGRGGGRLRPGRHLAYQRETPLTNLHVGLLERLGCPVVSFGDSTGTLSGLES